VPIGRGDGDGEGGRAVTSIRLPFRSTRRVSAWHRWFAERPQPGDRWRFAFYYHCGFTGPVPGFCREVKHTPLLDITPDEDALLAGFSKTTRYEIRRGGKDELEFGRVDDREDFRVFYDPQCLLAAHDGDPGDAGRQRVGDARLRGG
jgi:hypothetical protein